MPIMNAHAVAVLTLSRSRHRLPTDAFAAEPAPLREQERGTRRLGIGEPLSYGWLLGPALLLVYWSIGSATGFIDNRKIGRASCRERVCQYVEISVVAVPLKKKKK